ncbi:MAG TPA: lactonase family protein [Pseudoduganella sp.]
MDKSDRALLAAALAALMTGAHGAETGIRPADAPCIGERIYIGTHQQNGAQSIFTSTFDEQSGTFGIARAVSAVVRPTWLVKDPDRPVLYSVSETGNDGLSIGKVFSLRIQGATGDLEEINQVPSGGGGPTHLALDSRSHTLFVANFGTGHVAALPVADKGELDTPVSIGADHGTGPTPRQRGPHAHGATIDPTGRFVLVPDMGADRVFIYRFSAGRRALVRADMPFLQLPPGSGPRHLSFSPDGRTAYLLTELTAELRVYGWDATRAMLQPLQTLPIAGAGYQGARSAGEIVVSGDGRRVYVSSRGEDAIVTYAVDARSGRLSESQRISSGGRQPWHLALSPGGRWLLASNEATGSVNVFAVDADNGRLTASNSRLEVATPVNVVFAGACPRR